MRRENSECGSLLTRNLAVNWETETREGERERQARASRQGETSGFR